MKLLLERQQDNGIQTIGKLSLIEDNKYISFRCFSLELPYKNNKPNISCIPKGIYPVKKCEKYPSFQYQHFDILNVPKRFGIKIHAGNFIDFIKKESKGCILVGEKLTDINKDGMLDLINSKKTLKILYSIIPNNTELIIEIK